jgi:hypothetical protein
MKPRVSVSPPPISVGDDEDDDDGANDARRDSIDLTISRSVGRHDSAQHNKGQRSNGVRLGFGFGLGMGDGIREDKEHERGLSTVFCTSAAYTQEQQLAVVPVARSSEREWRGKPNEYRDTQTRSCAEHLQSSPIA